MGDEEVAQQENITPLSLTLGGSREDFCHFQGGQDFTSFNADGKGPLERQRSATEEGEETDGQASLRRSLVGPRAGRRNEP